MNIPHGFYSAEIFSPHPLEEVKLIVRCNTWPEGKVETATGHLEQDGKWFIQGFEGACFKVIAWAEMGNHRGQSTETL